MISARIVADSLSPQNHRLTSFIIRFPRMILAEFNTHRMLTRNSASSRAIPFKRMVEMVAKDPFIPICWPIEHTGMSATNYYTESEAIQLQLIDDHLLARDYAVYMAEKISEKKVSKQICNRYLEPFMWHTVLITASELENFFALRADVNAEPHMKLLAEEMLKMYNESKPKQLKAGEWHMPFGDEIDENTVYNIVSHNGEISFLVHPKEECDSLRLKIATARCARISYATLGDAPQKHDYESDIKMHDRLVSGGHWSPFEHCAQVMSEERYFGGLCDQKFIGGDDTGHAMYEYGWCGNFRGFVQYRKLFPNENHKDSRVIKHEYI